MHLMLKPTATFSSNIHCFDSEIFGCYQKIICDHLIGTLLEATQTFNYFCAKTIAMLFAYLF